MQFVTDYVTGAMYNNDNNIWEGVSNDNADVRKQHFPHHDYLY